MEKIDLHQAYHAVAPEIDVSVLAGELALLQNKLSAVQPRGPDATGGISAVRLAQEAAKKGDKAGALQYLAKAGAWVLEAAKEIGVKIAVKALENAMGVNQGK